MPKETARGIIEVLHVEDDASEAELLRQLLSELPRVAVRTLSDGAAALAHLGEGAAGMGTALPDLILLDLNLPGIDGRRVLAHLKGDPVLRAIPVVVLSSSTLQEDVALAYQLGANAYVVKPFHFEDYRSVVRALSDFWFGVALGPARRPPSRR